MSPPRSAHWRLTLDGVEWSHGMGRTAELFSTLTRGDPWTLREGEVIETASGRCITWPEVGAALADAFEDLANDERALEADQ